MKNFVIDVLIKQFLKTETVLKWVYDYLIAQWAKGKEHVSQWLYDLTQRVEWLQTRATLAEVREWVYGFDEVFATEEWARQQERFNKIITIDEAIKLDGLIGPRLEKK